jgi:hypothetical protein
MAHAQTGGLPMAFPLDCTLGETCYIQQYKDRDPETGSVRDFGCGVLAKDGHSGTDFALPSLAAMVQGVAIRPVAPGTVRAVRDGMDDISSLAENAPDITGRDCGNGMQISHGGGWQTRYCHMKKGSVTVKSGDKVSLTTKLGEVGISGRASFPHLHLTVLKDGVEVDPFRPDPTETCSADPDDGLWSAPLPYTPGGLISWGFHTAVPDYEIVKSGLESPKSLPSDTPAMVLWGFAFGAMENDVLSFEITGPTGNILDTQETLTKSQPFVYRATGKRTPPQGWPVGTYNGEITHMRGDTVLGSRSIGLTITAN